jgi:hypothetical protein
VTRKQLRRRVLAAYVSNPPRSSSLPHLILGLSEWVATGVQERQDYAFMLLFEPLTLDKAANAVLVPPEHLVSERYVELSTFLTEDTTAEAKQALTGMDLLLLSPERRATRQLAPNDPSWWLVAPPAATTAHRCQAHSSLGRIGDEQCTIRDS